MIILFLNLNNTIIFNFEIQDVYLENKWQIKKVAILDLSLHSKYIYIHH